MIHDTHFFTHFAGNAASSGNGDHKPGLLRRIVRAMVESRQRQTDREIARFLARSGGRLTVAEFPLWVRSGHHPSPSRCPLYPQKRTWIGVMGMSALCGEF